MPDENRNFSSSNICKRCNNSVTTGHQCRKCGTISHKSCLKTIKAIFYDDSTVDCCLNVSASLKPSSVVNSESTDSVVDIGKSVEQIKIEYLEEIVRQKDLVIKNQAMLVDSLQAQITLLNRNVASQTQRVVNIPPTSISDCGKKELSNKKKKNKAINKKVMVEHQNAPQISSSDVSRALHMAHTSKICNEVVNLTSDLQVESQKPHKIQRNSRKLIVGNADSDSGNSSFKSATIVQMRYFHITNCDPNTTQEDLMQYLEKIVPMVQVEQLKSRNPVQYASFKISVPTVEASKILKPEVWPSGVVVNHFFRAKHQSKPISKET